MQLIAIKYKNIPVLKGITKSRYVEDKGLSKHSTSFKKMFSGEYQGSWYSGSQYDRYILYEDTHLNKLYRVNPWRDEDFVHFIIFSKVGKEYEVDKEITSLLAKGGTEAESLLLSRQSIIVK